MTQEQQALARMHAFLFDETGVTSIEYALIASLIAIAILGGVSILGSSVQALWERVAGCVSNPASCA